MVIKLETQILSEHRDQGQMPCQFGNVLDIDSMLNQDNRSALIQNDEIQQNQSSPEKDFNDNLEFFESNLRFSNRNSGDQAMGKEGLLGTANGTFAEGRSTPESQQISGSINPEFIN